MSEKRFKLKENLEDVLIEDLITQSKYSIYGIVDLLNEQDLKILSLENEHKRQNNEIKLLRNKIYELRKGLEKIIKEQTLRIYCQDKEIQKLLQQIKELKET